MDFLEILKTVITAPLNAILLTLVVWLIYDNRASSKVSNDRNAKLVENNTKAMVSLEKSVKQESVLLSNMGDRIIRVEDKVGTLKTDFSVHCSKVERIEKTVESTKDRVDAVGYEVKGISNDLSKIKRNYVSHDEIKMYIPKYKEEEN